MSHRLFHLFTAAVAALTLTLAGVSSAQDQRPHVSGIWARGDTVLLFAFFRACGDESADYPSLQTLISKDAGKTWAKTGPRFYGEALMFILPDQGPNTIKDAGNDASKRTKDQLWLASEWVIEGPGDPALMLFAADSAEWPRFKVEPNGYGTADLLAIARDEGDHDRFLAWIERDLDIVEPDPEFDPDSSPIYLNESLDGGRTWRRVKRVKEVPKSVPGLRFFIEIPEQSGDWRVANGSSALEHRESDGKWHQVAKLPLPIQQTCEDSTTKD
jgi:hypothetical protein